jgi:hypothetical protein
MIIETSKTLYEFGYSNGSINLLDLFHGKELKSKANNVSYQDVINLILNGSYSEPGLISGIKIEKLLQQGIEFENNIGRNSTYYKLNTDRLFEKVYMNAGLVFTTFPYPTMLDTLNFFSSIYSYKSMKDLKKNAHRRTFYFFHEPSVYLKSFNLGEKDLVENKSLLNSTYLSVVLRNLSVFSENNNLTLWLKEIDKTPDSDFIFISDINKPESRTICMISDLNIANALSNRIKLKKYISDNGGSELFQGVVLLPFGEYEFNDGIHHVPLSCLKD